MHAASPATRNVPQCQKIHSRTTGSKVRLRAKVEQIFRILKRVFGIDKVRYRGIAKNHERLCAKLRC